ncbi:helix-turn-helix domain-containing protein [Falsibacillus albus]|uniref:AraC family transcriptional regulator n=1 Tax=Falsibacillus albus TaxID=2478915 RepID=A0A3L7JTL8_9BACI|nr:AraC family transcriptional regulator [Falsibacillus albus]RLQ94066.1 AraC family transcriptional regulator [Falsibacillus albus]
MESNFILHAKSKEFYWEGQGQLSIKTFSNGIAHYRTNQGFFAVEDSRFLLLNPGDYAISIESDQEVESFCLFFQPGFAEDIQRSMNERNGPLLDDPFKPIIDQSGFFEKTYEMPPGLSTLLDQMKSGFAQHEGDHIWREEYFQHIMQHLLLSQKESLAKVHSLSAERTATKLEIFHRVSIAHDYIQAYFHLPITLEQIGKASGLSTNHLLRTYRAIHGTTPHKQITSLRMERAKKLLKYTGSSMMDITLDIGLCNPVSFSKLFRKHTGLSPSEYRKKVILDKNFF